MQDKYQGDFFEVSAGVGIDLNRVVALKERKPSLEVFTDQRGKAEYIFISDKQMIQDLMYRLIQKYGEVAVNVMFYSGKHMNIR